MNRIAAKIRILSVGVLAAALLVAACTPFTDDLDRFLHYWTNITILYADGTNDWKKLKDAVAASPGNTMIVLIGEFTATTAAGNNGEIVIDKELTIQSKVSGGGDAERRQNSVSRTGSPHFPCGAGRKSNP